MVALSLVFVRCYEPGRLGAAWAAAVVAALATTPLTLPRLATAQLPFLSFGVGVLMVNAVTRGGVVVASFGPFEVTDGGLGIGAALGLRTLLVGVAASAFLAVVDPGRLLVSLHQVARLPVRVTYALLAAHRLLDDLPDEWMTIRQAHAVRAPAPFGSGGRRLSRSPRALGRAAFALLATSIRRAERVALSLESRGLGGLDHSRRTSWRVARPTWRDAVLVASVAAAVGAVLLA